VKEDLQKQIDQLKVENEKLKETDLKISDVISDNEGETPRREEELSKREDELKKREDELKKREEDLKKREEDPKRTPRTYSTIQTPIPSTEKTVPWKASLKKIDLTKELVKQPEKEVVQVDFRSVLKKTGETPRDPLLSPDSRSKTRDTSPRDDVLKTIDRKPSVYDLKLKFQKNLSEKNLNEKNLSEKNLSEKNL